MLVESVMSRSVVTLQPQQTLRDAIDLLRSKHIRHLPVVEGGKLVGIVSDRDVKRTTPSLVSGIEREEYDEALETTKVSRFMTRDPVTVSPRTSLKAAVAIFIERKVGALPVVGADGALEGIVTEIDLLRVLHGMLPD
jgi:acetoin utilization protein AcuB